MGGNKIKMNINQKLQMYFENTVYHMLLLLIIEMF